MRQSLLFLSLLLVLQVWSQDAQSILKKHFEDYGQALWNDAQTVQIDGRQVDPDYYGCAMKLTYKAPDKIRIEGIYKNQKFAEATNGTTAWTVAPWRKKYELEAMTPAEELVINNLFTRGSPLYLYRDHLVFKGLTTFEGEMYLTFSYSDAAYHHTYYLGKEDYRLYFQQIETRFGSSTITVLKVTEKYKSHGGMLMPTAAIFESEQIQKEYIFDQIFLGMGASDTIFEKPQPK